MELSYEPSLRIELREYSVVIYDKQGFLFLQMSGYEWGLLMIYEID